MPEVAAPMSEPDTSRPEQHWLDSPTALPSPLPSQDVTSNPSPRPVVATNKKYQCPSCYLDSNPVGFGRKSDFKKHLHNFHGADVVWICRSKGCQLTYSTERAYSTHAKETHRMDALANSAARTELCPQLVFSCGFGSCRDRVFEAQDKEESGACRDKYFEHIAKHFEDGFDVNDWEYRVQIQNLMRQQRVKSTWKTCIWPKERRQQLVWRPRSSGDLMRMLECRHLGEDISTLVRLAFILGTPPFTNSRTPPPSEIDLHFQLPFRSQCLIDAVGHSETKSEDGSSGKSRNSLPGVLSKLPSRKSKTTSRPPTPSSTNGNITPPMDMTNDAVMKEDPAVGPHPGTPFHIPDETYVPLDAPKFAPEVAPMPRQLSTPISTPMDTPPMAFHMPSHEDLTQPQHFHPQNQPDQIWAGGAMDVDPMAQYVPDHAMMPQNDFYDYTLSSSQGTVRPATPIPHKRPASWSKIMSMEALRPRKKLGSPGSELDEPIPAAMPNMAHHMFQQHHHHQPQPQQHEQMPTSMPMNHGFDLPMRMGHEQQHHFGPEIHMNTPTTFFFDDTEGRM